ncbi:putative ABC-type ATPase [Arcicella aurantiaca]|uniref:Putative ABC-type ATPase n=1 Tax=Arcicella aurantiaca TaxID=591202 RepID=A0A316EDX2_9BACT|nr:zeta toxin family protein [Arcicella aurantiaca]PWK28366.1 putative ABC-type ATPase [Arcicella aurantiaca]
MPNLYIIAGHNGAGKSTFGRNLLPSSAQDLSIFDGDIIFSQKLILAKQSIKVHKYAVQQAEEETIIEFKRLSSDAIVAQKDFAYEGHFSNANSWDTIHLFKEKNYSINMVFLGLATLNLSEIRVKDRVQNNGFFVPPYAIFHNYFGNLRFLNQNFHLIDNLYIWDTSSGIPRVLLAISNHKKRYIADLLPQWFIEYLPALI